jgi:uncharacterized protein (TIGR02678 family)
LVRKHAAWLRDWLAQHPRWGLHVNGELARLRKTPADTADGTRPARDEKQETAFTRRRYALVALALAALERSDRQTTLGKLAGEVQSFIAAEPALSAELGEFDLSTRDQRRDLVHAVRLLIDLRVLVHVHGDEQQYVQGPGDALYGINRTAAAAMLNVKRGPSTVPDGPLDERIAAIIEEPSPDTDEARNRSLNTRLVAGCSTIRWSTTTSWMSVSGLT